MVVSRSEGGQGLSKKILKFVEQEEVRGGGGGASGSAGKKKAAKEPVRKPRKGKVDLFDDVFAFTG